MKTHAQLYKQFAKDFIIVATRVGYDVMDKEGFGLEIHECFSWASCLDESINFSHFELHYPYVLRGRRVKLQSLSFFAQSFVINDYIDSYPQYQPLLEHARRQNQAYLDLKRDLKWHMSPHTTLEHQIGV